MTKLLGEWKLISSENFDAVMKKFGVNFILRKLGNTTKPNIKFEVDGDQWTFTTSSSLKTHVVKFELNKEFEEETLDGRKVRSIYTIENDKLINHQKDKDGKEICVIVRELNDKDELISVVTAGDVVSTRVYHHA